MIYLDQTCSNPELNLALDEWLLDRVEREGGAWLRIWRPTEEFVVIGRGNKAESEVNLRACERDEVPVLRRFSGGGAVVLGPGCLCYTLIQPMDADPALSTAAGTNRWMLQRISRAISRLLTDRLEICGDSDLALNDLKVAGHAQRRKRFAVLFHGSLLLNFDLARMGRFLLPPSRAPAYREGRSHEEFVANLHLAPEEVTRALVEEWQATAADSLVSERKFHPGKTRR